MTTRFSRPAGRFVCSALLAVSLGLSSSLANADPTPADIESARALYVQGLELRDQGDLASSAQRFKAAHSLAPTPITTLELGRAEMLLGHLVESRDLLLGIDRMPPRPEESAKARAARDEAKALSEQVRRRIPSLKIVLEGAPDGVRITVDGVAVPPESLVAPRRLNPGKHIVEAEASSGRGSAEVTLLEAETRTVSLALGVNGAPVAAVVAPATEGKDAREPSASAPPGPLFYGGLVLAGAGLAVGGVTGGLTLARAGRLSEACTGDRCPPTSRDDLDTAKTMSTIANIGFAVAGVGVVLAVVGWLTRGPDVQSKPPALSWTR